MRAWVRAPASPEEKVAQASPAFLNPGAAAPPQAKGARAALWTEDSAVLSGAPTDPCLWQRGAQPSRFLLQPEGLPNLAAQMPRRLLPAASRPARSAQLQQLLEAQQAQDRLAHSVLEVPQKSQLAPWNCRHRLWSTLPKQRWGRKLHLLQSFSEDRRPRVFQPPRKSQSALCRTRRRR